MKLFSTTLVLLCTLAASAPSPAQEVNPKLLGNSVSASPSQRTIVVNANTRWVNVDQFEAVRFNIGGQQFSWRFDGLGARSFDLGQIAPQGALSHPVKVYVAQQTEFP